MLASEMDLFGKHVQYSLNPAIPKDVVPARNEDSFVHLPQVKEALPLEPDLLKSCRILRKLSEELSLPEVHVSFEKDMTVREILDTLALLPPGPFLDMDVGRTRIMVSLDNVVVRRVEAKKKDLVQLLEVLEDALSVPDVLMAARAYSPPEVSGVMDAPVAGEEKEGTLAIVRDNMLLVINTRASGYTTCRISVKVKGWKGRARWHLFNNTTPVQSGTVPQWTVAEALPYLCSPFPLQTMAACPLVAKHAAEKAKEWGTVMPYGTPCLEREGATLTTTCTRAGCFMACPHLSECPYSERTTPTTPGVYNLSVWGRMAEMAGLPVEVKGIRVEFEDRVNPVVPVRTARQNDRYTDLLHYSDTDTMRAVVYLADVDRRFMNHAACQIVAHVAAHSRLDELPQLPSGRVHEVSTVIAAVSKGVDREVVERVLPHLAWVYDEVKKYVSDPEYIKVPLPSPYTELLQSMLRDDSGSVVLGDI